MISLLSDNAAGVLVLVIIMLPIILIILIEWWEG